MENTKMNKKITLLKKEMLLTASPRSYFFIVFGFMALIPNYPILLGAFFVCLGIFGTFQNARESGDIFYTNMLPVEKKDVVKAKYFFTVFIQMASFLLMAILSVIRMIFLADVVPYSVNTLMNANLVYLAWNLFIFAAFNIWFVGGFFKTAYKLGVPFIVFGIISFVLIMIGESLHFLPGMGILNDTHFQISHVFWLIAGICCYIIATIGSMSRSIKNFEKIDL